MIRGSLGVKNWSCRKTVKPRQRPVNNRDWERVYEETGVVYLERLRSCGQFVVISNDGLKTLFTKPNRGEQGSYIRLLPLNVSLLCVFIY